MVVTPTLLPSLDHSGMSKRQSETSFLLHQVVRLGFFASLSGTIPRCLPNNEDLPRRVFSRFCR